jgi:hypothetical protein
MSYDNSVDWSSIGAPGFVPNGPPTQSRFQRRPDFYRIQFLMALAFSDAPGT